MIRWLTALLIGLSAVSASAQAPPAYPTPARPATPYRQTTPYPTTPYATGPTQYPTMRYPTSQYPSMHYPSSPPTATGRPLTPAETAARKQSGLSESDVRTLLQGEGYTRLNSVQAEPGSTWVWQADAIKNGRPVRVGVDYRGNVLVIAPASSIPCASPGAYYGVGGAGARLSAAGSCRR